MDDLYQTAETLPNVERHKIYAHQEAADEWVRLPYRNSLWLEDGRAVGWVTADKTVDWPRLEEARV